MTPRVPAPPIQGDRLKIWNLIRRLSRRHEITLLTMATDAEDAENAGDLRKWCERIETVIVPKWRHALKAATALPTRLPVQVGYYRSQRFNALVHQRATETPFNLVHSYLLRSAQYTVDLRLPRLLDATDAMSLYLETWRAAESHPLKRTMLGEEFRRMERYEQCAERFNAVSVCSERDAEIWQRVAPGGHFRIVRNGVDLDTFKFRNNEGEDPTILFTGNLRYAPNDDAARYFCTRILPRIRRMSPTVSVIFAGQPPTPATARLLQRGGIILTGKVPEIVPFYRTATIAISPIRFGAGSPMKVLESMAVGVPMVATSTAVAGLPQVHNDEHLLLRDEPDAFALACCRLLDDVDLRRRLAVAARACVTDNFDWDAIALRMDEVYRETVERYSHSVSCQAGTTL